MLKHGDLVKYHIETEELYILGFVLGRVYMVKKALDGSLTITPPRTASTIVIQDATGELTDHADNFTMHRCPVELPIGRAN